jgi:hypothetical protein
VRQRCRAFTLCLLEAARPIRAPSCRWSFLEVTKMDSVQLGVAREGAKSQVSARFPVTYPVNGRIRGLRVGKTPCPLPEVLELGHQT